MEVFKVDGALSLLKPSQLVESQIANCFAF